MNPHVCLLGWSGGWLVGPLVCRSAIIALKERGRWEHLIISRVGHYIK